MMKFLIIGDLHGQMPKLHYKEFDAVIAPGDFCSDKGIRECILTVYRKYVKDTENSQEWWDVCGKKKAKKYVLNSVKAGRKILDFLDKLNVPVFMVPGNWDWTFSNDESWNFLNQDFYSKKLVKRLKNIVDLDSKTKRFQNYQFIGYGTVSGPELLRYRHYKGFKLKRYRKNEKHYRTLVNRYDKLFKKAKKTRRPIIFLSHNVPFNTRLDRIINKQSPMNGYHYGSNLARKMIQKHQPLLSIGGHMHEHHGKDRIGKTTVINAGFGKNVNTFLELEGNRIRKLEFWDGKN